MDAIKPILNVSDASAAFNRQRSEGVNVKAVKWPSIVVDPNDIADVVTFMNLIMLKYGKFIVDDGGRAFRAVEDVNIYDETLISLEVGE